MKNTLILVTASFLFVLQGCSPLVYQSYDVPQYNKTTHEEVMSTFTTKGQVFIEFGVPDQQFTLDSITSYYYKFGEETKSITSGKSAGVAATAQAQNVISGIMAVAGNPYYKGVSTGPVFNTYSVTSFTNTSNTESFIKYARFWIIGDKVVKWETQGIDKSILTQNPHYDLEEAERVQIYNEHQDYKRHGRRTAIGFFTFLAILTTIVFSTQ